jgi:hypothetical protein
MATFAADYKKAAAKAAYEAAAPSREQIKKEVKRNAEGTAAKAVKLGDPGYLSVQLPPSPYQPPTASTKGGRKTRRRFKKHRLMSRKYCKKTPCRRMGFTQKASCRPYKNCYRK